MVYDPNCLQNVHGFQTVQGLEKSTFHKAPKVYKTSTVYQTFMVYKTPTVYQMSTF